MTSNKRRFFYALAIFLPLALGLAGFLALTLTRPPLARKRPVVVAPSVRVVTVELQDTRVVVRGEGTVQPQRSSTLSAEVAGAVAQVSPVLINGGQFTKDQVLLRIDDRDHQNQVTQARANLEDAVAKLKVAQAESEAALEEWRKYRGSRKGAPPPLVAKEPQLAAAQARAASAQASLAQAELNLSRTRITAPFNGRVTAKYVDLGQYLRVGDKVADIFSTDAAEIVVPLEDRHLAWLKVPGLTVAKGPGSSAQVEASFAGTKMQWPGQVVRSQGKLDERTRLVPVVVRVEKPYAKQPPLAAGLFVQVRFHGLPLQGAVKLPRSALRPGNMVWVVGQNDTLAFRKVEVAHLQGDRVLVSGGLKKGERVVVSQLRTVSQGMAVRPTAMEAEGRS